MKRIIQILIICVFSFIAVSAYASAEGEGFQKIENAVNNLIAGTTTGTLAITVGGAMADFPLNPAATVKKDIKYRIYIARSRDQVDIEAFPRPSNATIFNIPMLPGQFMHFIDCRTDSVRPNAAAAGEIAKSMTLTITADIEGLSKRLLEWLYVNNGERFFLIWEYCVTGEKFIAGSPCSGLQMTVTRLGTDDDWTGATLTFTSTCPDPFYYFEGTIPRATPVELVPDATSLALTDASQYVIPNNTTATAITNFTGITADSVGRIIDIIGAGTSFPSTIAPSANFILRNGSDFIAASGSRITFEVIQTGASTFALLELSRS